MTRKNQLPKLSDDNRIQVVFSFDTTGSMYPCLGQVRNELERSVKDLFERVPGIEIGMVAHGDFLDGPESGTYLTKTLDICTDKAAIVRFAGSVRPTHGAGPHAVYEHVLHEARSLSWKPGKAKVLVMIGDEPAHDKRFPDGRKTYAWKDELGLLKEAGVQVYGVQALHKSYSTPFYRALAEETGGLYMRLDQFYQITDVLLAICYKQAADEILEQFEGELESKRRLNRSMDEVLTTLRPKRKRKAKKVEADLHACKAGRFQILDVPRDATIRDFVEHQGMPFKKGRGFYEFMKAETIQDHKEVILMDRDSGDLFEGKYARELLKLPEFGSVKLKPVDLDKYKVFVQSTSYNRRLIGGTQFLYEVHE